MDLVRTLLEDSSFLIVVVDAETARVVDCNDAQCRESGRKREELIGQRAGALHMSYPLGSQELWSNFVCRVEKEQRLIVDTNYRRADGSLYPVQVECSLHQWAGRRYMLVVGRPAAGQAIQSRFAREMQWQKALCQMSSHSSVIEGRVVEAAAFIAALGKSVLPANHCCVWRADQGGLRRVADHNGPVLPGQDHYIDLAKFPWLMRALYSGRSIDLFEGCRNDDERAKARELAALYGARSVLCAPVRTGGRISGAVSIGSESPRAWLPDEIGFAGEIADQVAHAVASEELRVSRERYRRFIEMSAESVWRVDFTEPIPVDLPVEEQIETFFQRGRIADCNDAFGRFFGQSREVFVGMLVRDLLSPIDDIRRSYLRKMIEAGYRLDDFEVRHVVNGVERWTLRNVIGIIDDGKLTQLWGASRDITERKRAQDLLARSEQRYRAFVANSSEGIFRVEYREPIPLDLPPEEIVRRMWQTGTLEECNEAFARLRGKAKSEDLVGQPIGQFRLGSQEELQQDLEFVRRGCRITDVERPSRRADGSLGWFSHSMTGVIENGCLARIWGSTTDVTERRKLQEELRALSAWRDVTLEQERTRIAREIHDELGQKLTALKFDAAAWERGTRRPGKGDLTRDIDEAIQSVRRIATELRPAILDHFGLVAAIEWMSNDVSRRTGIECDCDLQADLSVDGSLATTVFRIFQESLTNAVRHAGADMVLVRLWTEDDRLHLVVEDNGRGIESAGKQSPPSFGLIGMRERAKDAGGAVTISGEPGRGTRVAAWFPLHHPTPSPEAI